MRTAPDECSKCGKACDPRRKQDDAFFWVEGAGGVAKLFCLEHAPKKVREEYLETQERTAAAKAS